jgi:hypothetical protein
VVATEWDALYLPTFGGVVRYDVSDPSNPMPIPDGYQPTALDLVEHIDIVWPDPSKADEALLLTATGTGSVQLWPVSATEPNPGEPILIERPDFTGAPFHIPPSVIVYGNDVTYYQQGGETWVLADSGIRGLFKRIVLVAYPLSLSSDGTWTSLPGSAVYDSEGSDEIKSNAKQVTVNGDHAFISGHGGFFVVRLDDLPDGLIETVAQVPVNLNSDEEFDDVQGIAVDETGTFIFIATDSSRAVASYSFNPDSGAVDGPLDILFDGLPLFENLPGTTSRGRYHAETDRFYISGRKGTIVTVDVSDPEDLKLISVWKNSTYEGEVQDVRVVDFGSGPRVLMVTDGEGFSILDPDDGM